jgi:hypothetical protein
VACAWAAAAQPQGEQHPQRSYEQADEVRVKAPPITMDGLCREGGSGKLRERVVNCDTLSPMHVSCKPHSTNTGLGPLCSELVQPSRARNQLFVCEISSQKRLQINLSFGFIGSRQLSGGGGKWVDGSSPPQRHGRTPEGTESFSVATKRPLSTTAVPGEAWCRLAQLSLRQLQERRGGTATDKARTIFQLSGHTCGYTQVIIDS